MKSVAFAAAAAAILAVLAFAPHAALAQDQAALPMAISITNSGINSSVSQPAGGLYLVTVTNDSSASRGLVIRGVDRAVSPYIRFTPVLRPGQQTSFLWYFPSDRNVRVQDLLKCTLAQRTCLLARVGRLDESLTFS